MKSPVRQVWIGARDPNPVAQGGAEHLRKALGLASVRTLEDLTRHEAFAPLNRIQQACEALIAPFAYKLRTGRPWMTVKQALDTQGLMVPPTGQKTFTNETSLNLAHQMRRATDALITGVGTVLADNPEFTVRRVVDHKVRGPRLLVVCARSRALPQAWCRAAERKGFKLIVSRDLSEVPTLLASHGVNWALIEAGPSLLAEVKRLELWDDWVSFITRQGEADQILLQTRSKRQIHAKTRPYDAVAQASQGMSPMILFTGHASFVRPPTEEIR